MRSRRHGIVRRLIVPSERRAFGDAGERAAERALVARGWRVVERNARTRYGEIDLVCRDDRGYVFVEVKTRRAGSFVRAVEAATPLKIARLQRLAEAWLALHGQRQSAWRLAVAALTVASGGTRIEIVAVSD